MKNSRPRVKKFSLCGIVFVRWITFVEIFTTGVIRGRIMSWGATAEAGENGQTPANMPRRGEEVNSLMTDDSAVTRMARQFAERVRACLSISVPLGVGKVL
jgi:hypothetical protein